MIRPGRFLGLALAAIAAAALAAAGALFLALDTRPRVPAMAAPTAEEVGGLKKTLERQDPRRLKPGEMGTLSLDRRELAIGVSRALELLGNGDAVEVEIQPGRLALRVAIELPTGLDRRFVNVDLRVREGEHLPRVERLALGRTRVPAALADAAWRRLADRWLEARGATDALDMVRAVAFVDDRLMVSYRWQPWTVDQVRTGLVTPAQKRRLEVFHRELTALTHQLPRESVPLRFLIGHLFELAGERSRDGDPVAENRAAILVLGSYIGGRSLRVLIPEAAEWPRPAPLEPTLHGKWDLARHFMISATLAAVGGPALSEALGLYKELEDRRDGSGFSFQDLAADRAGTRFGRLAVGTRASALRVQRILREELADSVLMPRVDDLPNGLSETEFERLVGDVGSPSYQRFTAEIDRRLADLPLYGGP